MASEAFPDKESSPSAAPLASPLASPLVSVLMPMRNPGRYLTAAIDSVLGQDHPALELLVIDDGSTDGSREAVATLRDPRVRLLDGPRQGISACLNHGLAQARGELVTRCDADDLYPAGRLRAQVDWLRAHAAAIAVCGPFSMIGPDGALVATPLAGFAQPLEDAAGLILDGSLRTHLCTFTFRRTALEKAGRFRPWFETAEDIDFALRLAEAGPVGYLPADAYRYRLHDASITHTQVSVRRLFFEDAARAMSRDRLATGGDALMRGEPPAAPVGDGPGHHAFRAGTQMAELLVGEAWRAFERGDRRAARQAAWRAVMSDPRLVDGWKAMLLVNLKRPRRPAAR